MNRDQVAIMLVFEFKVYDIQQQFDAVDEALRTVQFIRNKAIRLWIDNVKIGKNELSKYCAVLAKEFLFFDQLN
jgi:putative transposase